MKISIVVPTWQRAQWLDRCLAQIARQELRLDEVLVVGRQDDAPSRSVVDVWLGRDALPVRWVEVDGAGHISPVRKGLSSAEGDIIVFIDDDVEPEIDWLPNLVAPFDDQAVAVVGGRVLTSGGNGLVRRDAGSIRWYGKHIGNVGALDGSGPRDVDGVMECNWAWRTSVLRGLAFEPVFFDDDASMYGLDLCLQAKEKGHRIIYQPLARVFHHLAPRDLSLDRSDRGPRIRTYSRNYTYIALKRFRGQRRIAFIAWWLLIGERASYGMATAAFDLVLPAAEMNMSLMVEALKGKFEGVKAWRGIRS